MMSFAVGQRWVSQTEPKLGLGIVVEIQNRRVELSFPAAGESRTYAVDNAPISRVMFKVGDTITTHDDDEYLVTEVIEHDKLIVYEVLDEEQRNKHVSEVELDCFLQFTSPLQRLISGHFDRNSAFRVRYQNLLHKDRLQQSQVKGLVGARTSLLQHQVYIADQVSRRFAPRVLLADEVGLGKTIEAGLIIHAQLFNGLAKRVLIVVPNTLVHQWLVEMLRKFNLAFSIFDQARYDSLIEEGVENPFDSEQLILCDLDLLAENEEASMKACEAGWDIVCVDEAHHLHWTEDESSAEYQCVESLSKISHGLLLLTATPEQAGIDSHFARLRLLDPDRFYDLEAFKKEEQDYAPISAIVGELQSEAESEDALPADLIKRIEGYLGQDSSVDWKDAAISLVPDLTQKLIDRHGTGRVLFRNTRDSVEGFPERILHAYPLDSSNELQDELEGETDLLSDPRLPWLIDLFKAQDANNKILVICKSAELAITLEAHLRLKEGFATAAFHEGLSIIERDRAAAYFADKEEGAKALICSEIGSEGRNFQFARHLVLFDLPENPDLLEQRIGRLDRIGQMHDVNIHVPYLSGSKQEGLYRWYHEGLDAFEQSCAAGYALFEQFQNELESFLNNGNYASETATQFLANVRERRNLAMEELHKGRDPLLELNSCQPAKAEALIEQIELEEQSQTLASHMESLFNLYGVDQEFQSDHTLIIKPSDHMLTHVFPGLDEEGMTLTYQRLKGLVREDIEFVTWEHPMVVESMEQLLSSELGNAAVATMKVKGIKPGTLFLETIFTLNCMAPKSLQLDRFVPLSPMRFLVDVTGKDLSEVLPHDRLNDLSQGIKRSTAPAIIKQIHTEISNMLQMTQALAEPKLPALLEAGKQKLQEDLGDEIERVRELSKVNSLIRKEEVEFLEAQLKDSLDHIENVGLDVQAVRIIINT